jgi:hypothetical protein
LEFLELWEELSGPVFKPLEFERFGIETAATRKIMFAMNNHYISEFTPIICGLVFLCFALSKLPETKPLKPMLAICAGSLLLYGMLNFVLGDQDFRGHVGLRVVVSLDHFRSIFGGIGIGAVLTSMLYGHWRTALVVAIQRQKSIESRKERE